MRRFSFRRCLRMLAVIACGVAPLSWGYGCGDTRAQRQALINAGVGAFTGIAQQQVTASANPTGDPQVQAEINFGFNTLRTIIIDNLSLINPASAFERGRPG